VTGWKGVMSTPPLHWSIDVHALHAPQTFAYEANAQERDAIKRYAEVEEVSSFKASVRLTPFSGGRFKAAGLLEASAVQASVVDLGPVPASIEENFAVEFWPEEKLAEADEDGDAPSFESDPPEAIVGGRILIGEFLCELFSVSLDPYPRNPDDAFEWAPGQNEPKITPFAELAQLRRAKKPDGG
jgi:hypothetical protein